mmetsp:Transcript_22829/g.43646  ORF Transcript_22829/g.43646 Transcript_22829/m.43646 type:complete len:97 (+) Transcript_22829:1-291(+)
MVERLVTATMATRITNHMQATAIRMANDRSQVTAIRTEGCLATATTANLKARRSPAMVTLMGARHAPMIMGVHRMVTRMQVLHGLVGTVDSPGRSS